MFRPINSDDRTRFQPPPEQVCATDPVHSSGSREFAYEVERVERERKQHHGSGFGQDTFERSEEDQNSNEKQQAEPKPKPKERPSDEGESHVDTKA